MCYSHHLYTSVHMSTTHLSLWVCSYTNANVLQRKLYEIYQKHLCFSNILWLTDYGLIQYMKISMCTYPMHGQIPNSIDQPRWSSVITYSTYILLVGSDTILYHEVHVGVATRACRMNFPMIISFIILIFHASNYHCYSYIIGCCIWQLCWSWEYKRSNH